MTTPAPIWLTEADVVSLIDLTEAISALERGLELEARGAAHDMLKTHVTWADGASLHAIGATFADAGFVGTKTWAHTAGGATPLLILFDSHDGALRAIIEAFALGQMRTGGISGVATRRVAAADADELAIIGTGKQALAQVAAVAAVRPLRRVRVFSPNPAHRAQFIERVQKELDVATIEARTVAEAVDGAPIITLATRATVPFLSADMVGRGTHINAVGAITPERAELMPDVLERSDAVIVDSLPAVQKLSKELIDYYGAGRGSWDAVQPLSKIVAAKYARPATADLTLFKAMGTGIADLSLATEVYERAVQRGLGRRFAHPQRAQPRLTRQEK